ncbi:MAG: metallophosphoesterase [Bacteroidales bacterium]
MAHKILVVPDVHGRIFWKESVMHYLNDVDKVVFLGDYLDPYRDETGVADDIFGNMMEIIALKQNNWEKVVLLKGNHDQHYSSKVFYELARGTRLEKWNWQKYHDAFNEYKDCFKLAHVEEVKGTTYLFSHAGLTAYWLSKVNAKIWKLADEEISVADPDIIDRINLLDDSSDGQEMLSIVGRERSMFGEETGSVLWADVYEHPFAEAMPVYGLNKVFQVFGHTRLDGEEEDLVEFDHFAMIDSQKCFLIDEALEKRVVPIKTSI